MEEMSDREILVLREDIEKTIYKLAKLQAKLKRQTGKNHHPQIYLDTPTWARQGGSK